MQQSLPRTKQNFDNGWFFHKGDIHIPYAVKAGRTGGLTDSGKLEEGEWLEIAYTDKEANPNTLPKDWKRVAIPHDWCVEGQYVNDPNLGSRPASHGYLPVGVGVYRKIFEIPAEAEGQRTSIHFDGIMGKSTVWVNGHLIGTHGSGYTSFRYDLTEVLRYGNEGKNVMLVKVDATDYEGWWYEGCGIYRHVWLEQTAPLHVAHWGTYVTTPVITEESADVCIRTMIDNQLTTDQTCGLVSMIVNRDGAVVAQTSSQVTIPWKSSHELEQTVQVAAPELWSPEAPYLYKVITEVLLSGRPVDRYETTFGIRSIKFTADEGFFLNGRHTFIKGTCNHQDFAGVGVALPDSVIEYKLKLLKEMGCNAYRSAHHPTTPTLLDICDRIGMMVMDENRKLDTSPEGISQLKSMLYRDRNHPSIIIWSMENEEIIEGTVMGARMVKTFADITRRIDPTRPTLAAMNHGWNDGGYSDMVDIVGYNYGQRKNQALHDHEKYPQRIMIGSETDSYTTTRGIYENDELHGYCSSYGTKIPGWSCSPQRTWSDLVANRFLTGMFIWTGFDYRGEPTPYRWPCIHSHFGIMDTCGFPKDIYYAVKAAWTDEPVVHLLPHWNWAGREGEQIPVLVYSNCDSVELLVNGVSLGAQQVVLGSPLEWNVTYQPGEVIAVGTINGESAARHVVATTTAAAAIRLELDRRAINADGCDVAAVRVAVTDVYGRVVPFADNEVTFSLEGGASILGVGNGNPSSHEPDKANSRRAFSGWCLTLVQAGKTPGRVVLTATSPGLTAAQAVIEIQSW